MGFSIHVSTNYATHLPCLINAIEKTKGDVLELGMGVFSTPYLHYKCHLQKRKLVSYDNYEPWVKFFAGRYGWNYGKHEIKFIEKFEDAPIDKKWDVVLIDQTPASSRGREALRLANKAKYIILHDSDPKYDRFYRYSKVYPHFKYRATWEGDTNQATVLSNFVNLKDFWK